MNRNSSLIRTKVVVNLEGAEICVALTSLDRPGSDAGEMLRMTFLRRSLVFLAMLLPAAALAQPPATIYLIRHADKLTDGREDLSPKGFLRAAMIPQLFVPEAGSTRVLLPKPEFLFATAKSKHSNRPFETIMPLSSALNLPIANEIENDNFAGPGEAAVERKVCRQDRAGELASWQSPEAGAGLGRGYRRMRSGRRSSSTVSGRSIMWLVRRR